MNILFLSQYFPPEMGAPSARTHELAKYWAQAGHRVTVITGFPNHPTGKLHESYHHTFFKKEIIDGIRVIRTWIYAAPNKGFTKRVFNYLSFMVTSILLGTIPSGACDVVIATSPQFFTAVAGYVMSLLKRAPFVFEVRDFWPQSIIELGMLKNKFIISVLTKIELFLYRRAQKIVGVAESTRGILIGRGIDLSKIKIIPNGIDPQIFNTRIIAIDSIREKYRLNGEFIVAYIGTHGLSHGLDSVLKSAKILSANPNIVFVFVGEGAEKEHLIQQRDELELTNVVFIDEQPKERIPSYYQLSDVCLVTLKDLMIFEKVLPSKLFEIMACGKPIIGAIRGEAKSLIEQAKAGIVVEPENPQQLADTILYLYNNYDKLVELGTNGKIFVYKNYLRHELAEKYIEIMRDIVLN